MNNVKKTVFILPNLLKEYLGVFLCVLVAVLATFLGNKFKIIGGPVFAILLGIILSPFLKDKTKLEKGLKFTSKKVLQYAVILLGFGLNLNTVAKVGLNSLPIILSTITTSLVLAFFLCKALKVESNISILIGVGSSICGGSAIAATAPVIKAKDSEVAQAISVIFLFNVIAALLFPTLGQVIGLSDGGFALFAGSAVNDTSSVTATASAWEGITGATTVLDNATIVKLTRTIAIIPITLVLAFYKSKKEKNKDTSFSIKKIFPFFILYFILASLITTVSTTFFNVDESFFAVFKTLSKFFIVMAMSAIGINTNLVKLIKTGGKPIFMGFCCWVGITTVCLLMQKMLNLF